MKSFVALRNTKTFLLQALLMTVALLELLRTAWICDDAAITLRTVLNFTHGYGARFNVTERVQAFTHPLWFALISATTWITRNVFHSAFALSIAISVAALWLLLRRCSSGFTLGAVCVLSLLCSKAYVDFSTSGLENPLSHLMILAVVLSAWRALGSRHVTTTGWFATACSFLYLTRPDLLLMVAPLAGTVAFAHRNQPRRVLKWFAVGSLPALIWTLFSTFYYGFPFPNTAYAKLGMGIPLASLCAQGFRYILHSLTSDPLTVALIFVGIAAGLSTPSRARRSIATGIIAYLAYVISIGGDFMAGRFLTAPALMASVLLASSGMAQKRVLALGLALAPLAVMNLRATLFSDLGYSNKHISSSGIADERGYYFQKYGLMTAKAETFRISPWQLTSNTVLIGCGGIGFHGIKEGPSAHFIDICGLTDPLLARLPAKYSKSWRVGHFTRQIPTGYQESIETDRNEIVDASTRAYYEVIRNITRGPLTRSSRWRDIARVNFGRVQKPSWNMYRYDEVPARLGQSSVAALDTLGSVVDSGPWNAPGNIQFATSVSVFLKKMRVREIDLSVDRNDAYRVEVLEGDRFVTILTIQPTSEDSGMVRHIFQLAEPSPETEHLRLVAASGDEMYALGHLRVR